MPHLNTPDSDGTKDVVFEQLDFMAELAALVPTPRGDLIWFHRVFARSGHYFRFECLRSNRSRGRSWPVGGINFTAAIGGRDLSRRPEPATNYERAFFTPTRSACTIIPKRV